MAVESVMRTFAADANEKWSIGALWGCCTTSIMKNIRIKHCKVAPELLKKAGYDDAFIHAVVSHGYGLCSDVEPTLYMEKALYAVDELTGLIGAAALMRPSRSVMDIEVKSVKKKFKDKGFAAGCNREVILNGCAMLNMELDNVIARCIEGMRSVAAKIGL
jgi:predicted hydrolase (HD superfamily)